MSQKDQSQILANLLVPEKMVHIFTFITIYYHQLYNSKYNPYTEIWKQRIQNNREIVTSHKNIRKKKILGFLIHNYKTKKIEQQKIQLVDVHKTQQTQYIPNREYPCTKNNFLNHQYIILHVNTLGLSISRLFKSRVIV